MADKYSAGIPITDRLPQTNKKNHMKRKQTTESLGRLLNLVPLLSANPGIHLEELRRISGMATIKELRENLEKLLMFGRPPFSPLDFIEIYIDDEDHVDLKFPQGLDRPLALTPAEWAAVQKVIARELEFQRAGQRASSHLRNILNRLSEVPVSYEEAGPFQNKRDLVEEALQDRQQIEFLYRTLSSREAEIRRVDPWALFQHRRVTYLIGHCHLRRDARYFHLERMENIEILDVEQTSEQPKDLAEFMRQSPIFLDNPPGFTASLAFAPQLRGALELYFKIFNVSPAPDSTGTPEGWFRADCKVTESIWFRATLRSLGPDVMILEPQHLRSSYLEELEEIAAPDSFPGSA